MKTIQEKIPIVELKKIAIYTFGNLVKAVVDVEKEIKELARLREVLVDYFAFDNQYGSSDKLWRSYFYPFNFAVRKKC